MQKHTSEQTGDFTGMHHQESLQAYSHTEPGTTKPDSSAIAAVGVAAVAGLQCMFAELALM